MVKEYVLCSQGIEIYRTTNKLEAETFMKKENKDFYLYKQKCIDEFEPYADNEIFMFTEVKGMKGVVRKFDDAKGFGFIKTKDTDGDVFFHFSNIVKEGYKTIKVGTMVTFDLLECEKGKRATNVTMIKGSIKEEE